MSVAPREAATFSFQVAAPFEEARVRVGLADFDLDLEGRLAAGKAGERSCARVARVDRGELDLPAKSEATVRVRVDLPDGPPGTYWCLLTFEADAGARRSPDGSAVQVVPRVSVPILVTVSGGPPSKVTGSFGPSLERRGTPLAASLVLKNDGLSAVGLTGALSAEEAGGAGTVEVARQTVPTFLLLPGHARRLVLEVPARSALPLRLRAEFEFGEGRRLELESPLTK